MFLCYFFGLWVHALFSSLSFCYQYQCNGLPGKICPQNDLLCVEWGIKSCSTVLNRGATHAVESKNLTNNLQYLGNGAR